MRIAVLTLTRDRLAYTQHCFAELQRLAGCEYDHYVLDQGSQDGTVHWLAEWLRSADALHRRTVIYRPENIGIHHGFNHLLGIALRNGIYDVVVTFDNDCELLMRDTIRDLCELALAGPAILSPRIQGLRSPQTPTGEFVIDGDMVDEVPILGAICRAVPADVFTTEEFRFDESLVPWVGDETTLCAWWRHRGGRVGYVRRFAANHYRTTDGQHEDYPEYFARRVAEGGPV